MSTTGVWPRDEPTHVFEPSPESVWRAASGEPITDELLEWPPDLFALTNVILTRSEAFRFAVSPIGQWPPERFPDWGRAVDKARLQWSAWVEDRRGETPTLLTEEWSAFRERAELPLEQLAQGRDPRTCEALLTLHAIADEACAGLGIALDTFDGRAPVYRARGRELLSRTGSLARVNPRLLRVLPKVCTPPTGRAAFSRYACVQGPAIEARWHKMPARHRGTDPRSEYARILLLPWPLRVRDNDFRTLDEPVQRPDKEPFGFFEFAPAEGLDLDLLDRVLLAAHEEVESVDVVVLPESAVDVDEIEDLEAVLHRHGVVSLEAGVRERSSESNRQPANWMHIGMNSGFVKGAPLPGDGGGDWFHLRQNKHHRWSLDERQIYQYHLGGVLHPSIRWWEAIDVPRRAVQFIEVAELTLACLVCEDLAQSDEVAELIRSVGPTVVFTVLLDGPQLSSRWAARYASVLADDPGSAVLTLTSYGMVERSKPHGRDATPVVALWKDPARGIREISLEPGAHAVLLTVCADRAARRSADGRRPVDNGTHAFDVSLHQIWASSEGAGATATRSRRPTQHILEVEELTVLTAWAEAIAEALAYAPERLADVLTAARPGSGWRPMLGLPEPSERLTEAIDSLDRVIPDAPSARDVPTFDALLATLPDDPADEDELDGLARRVLLAMMEERRTREPVPAER